MITIIPGNTTSIFVRAFLPTTLVLMLLACGKQKNYDETNTADTSSVVEEDESRTGEAGDVVYEDGDPVVSLWPKGIISYRGTTNDETRSALENFSLLTPVLEEAARCIAIKDSLKTGHYNADGSFEGQLATRADSAAFRPQEIKAWQTIQEYKKLIESKPSLTDPCPSLLDLTRETTAEDKSGTYLPEAGASRYLAHGKFFFLGGSPFISEITTEDGTPFSDAKGNPEKRYSSLLTENGRYMLTSLYHFRSVRTVVSFGGPLRSYDAGPREVQGVGSLIHEFVEPHDVFFLTEAGVVQARLISAKVKLVPEDLGCVSDHPEYIFACSKNIDASDILAVYVPYHSEPVTEFNLERHSEGVWTADLNEDGIADLACVSGSFEGISSDAMAEVLWFVNINGTWKILDYASDLDCT